MSAPAPTRYTDPRAHALRERYVRAFGGADVPVPVEAIAEDLLGLRVAEADLGECSGILLPAERLIVVNAAEGRSGDRPTFRHRFTIAHELGHWICHVLGAASPKPTYCRSRDLDEDADRDLEREANVFGAELLMPEAAVRAAWAALPDPEAVAETLQVSLLSTRWRLYSFGLADKPV